MNTRIAVPSCLPGGLDAAIGMHFGKCDIFTVIDIADGAVSSVTTIPSVPHEHGGCLAPVQIMADNKVQAMLCGGMGMRPLQGFASAGIDVYATGLNKTVGQAVDAFIAGKLAKFSPEHSCSCHHHHD